MIYNSFLLFSIGGILIGLSFLPSGFSVFTVVRVSIELMVQQKAELLQLLYAQWYIWVS